MTVSLAGLFQKLPQVSLPCNRPSGNSILVTIKNRIANLCRFYPLFFLPEHLTDELTGSGLQRTVTAVAVDKRTKFISQ